MIPTRDVAAWEQPFCVLQRATDRFVTWSGRLPGIVQLGLYPFALAVSLLHVPFALTHLLISAIINRISSPELPTLTREELCELARTTRAKWVSRHKSLRECNPADAADDIALPVVTALAKAIDALDGHTVNRDRLNQLASQLIDLPATTAPDAHMIGLCIRRHAESDTIH